MYCVYCGSELESGKCTKCETSFSKKKVFTVLSDYLKAYEDFYCHYCGRPVCIVIDERPKEVGGICTHCARPTRLNRRDKEGDSIFV